MDKLNKTFQSEQVLTADEMNQITGKIDEIIDNSSVKTINGEEVSGTGNIVINPTIMDLKWTTNVATTRKLVPAELRKKGVKIAYTDSSSVYHVEQYQSEAIDDTSWGSDANWKGCRTPLTPLFENAGAVFNNETGYYEMNELTDLTENDIYKSWICSSHVWPVNSNTDFSYSVFVSSPYCMRTNFPLRSMFKKCKELSAYGQNKLEVLTLMSDKNNTGNQPFQIYETIVFFSCTKLRKIIGVIDIGACSKDFWHANNTSSGLEHILISKLRVSTVCFKYLEKIDVESIQYIVDNAANTSAITITVHPTTYGYLTGTIEPTEQVGGTTEEWQQIVTDAAEKQITFATTE